MNQWPHRVRAGGAGPEDLGRFFVERANAGDVEGLVGLYEPDAVLALPAGQVSVSHAAIHRAYERMLAGRPTFPPGQAQPALRHRDLALTLTRLAGGGTAEVARRRPDGTWLWIMTNPPSSGSRAGASAPSPGARSSVRPIMKRACSSATRWAVAP